MSNNQFKEHLQHLSNTWLLPSDHVNYLRKMRDEFNIYPKVMYDIGSCVLRWTKEAKNIWPESKIYAFEAMDTVDFLYDEEGIEYYIGVFSDENDKELIFYQSNVSPGGNSYYKEKSWATEIYYNKESERLVKTITIDTAVKNKNFQYPDLVKIDVQGCEVDILKGMTNILQSCEHLIIELQREEYNVGAMLSKDSIPFIKSLGFELITPLFSNNGIDGDYHFKKIK